MSQAQPAVDASQAVKSESQVVKAEQDATYVNLTVKRQDGSTTVFRIKPQTILKKVNASFVVYFSIFSVD